MTEVELAIQDVVDVWLAEDAGRKIEKHGREYNALVRAFDNFLKKREDADAVKFHKAVEQAYQKGYDAGCRLKG